MCDTIVALKNVTKNKTVIFAKNSDRQPDEPAEILHVPRKKYSKGSEIQTTYITIPQINETAEILLCKPIWIWGAEMGANEHGVVIGNEAVYTKEKYRKKGGLLGMDLLRLGLERAKNAKEALEIIIDLLELYGQGGNSGYRRKDFYQNAFIIADKNNAWVLETADKFWIAEEVKDIRTISNSITIRGKGDIRHPEIISNAIEKGWCKDEDDFDFLQCYLDKYKIEQLVLKGLYRTKCATNLLKEEAGEISELSMMKVLRYHHNETTEWNPTKYNSFNSLCIHAKNILNPSQSTISMVSSLGEKIQTHWITGTSAPCTSIFKPVFLPGGMPTIGSKTTSYYDSNNIWWKHEELHRLTIMDYANRLAVYKEERNDYENKIFNETETLRNKLGIEKNNHIANKLQEFTKNKFEESDTKEAIWVEKIKNMPIINKTSIFYRNYWKKLNKRNKMPF